MNQVTRVRERLERAGLLASPFPDAGAPRPRVDPDALAAARSRAAHGTSLVDLVATDRE